MPRVDTPIGMRPIPGTLLKQPNVARSLAGYHGAIGFIASEATPASRGPGSERRSPLARVAPSGMTGGEAATLFAQGLALHSS